MAGSRESLPTPASRGAGDRHLVARKQRRRRFSCRSGAAYGVSVAPVHGLGLVCMPASDQCMHGMPLGHGDSSFRN